MISAMETISLFDWAAEARDSGMAEAALAETLVNPDFAEVAYAAICHVARRQSEVHVDDVLRYLKVRPSHPNAFGAVWLRAIRDGTLLKTGRVKPCLSDSAKRVHNYPIYDSGLFHGRRA